jgi:hypothetical protein
MGEGRRNRPWATGGRRKERRDADDAPVAGTPGRERVGDDDRRHGVCQTEIVEKVREKQVDHLLAVKDNQPTLHGRHGNTLKGLRAVKFGIFPMTYG